MAFRLLTLADVPNRIPRITLEDGEVEVTDDPQDCTRLDVSNAPVTVTLTKVRDCAHAPFPSSFVPTVYGLRDWLKPCPSQ
jgi:hypothetical protein